MKIILKQSIVKPDAYPALYAELNCHNIDLCCISKTWLHPTISSSLLCPPGFHIIRKDRLWSRGGGVAILCRNDWKIENIQNMDNPFVCLWARITIQNSSFDIAVVYHPPEHDYDANDLIDILTDSSEQLLSENPNAEIIITGDLNKLNIYNLLNQLSFAQLVKSPTRGKNILDVFITNVPHYWKKVKVTNSLVRSDHKAIIAYTRDSIKACRTDSFFRDTREHRTLSMFKELETVDWQKIKEYGQTPDQITKTLYEL